MTQKENPDAANGEASETDHATKLIDSEITPEASTTQAARNLVGLQLRLPKPCPKCCGVFAQIGGGRGPHKASIICACSRYLGWMSQETFNFISETVRNFGTPTEPILVRHRSPPAPRCESCGDTPEQTSLQFADGSQASFADTATGPASSN
jgi:hypothetical protein